MIYLLLICVGENEKLLGIASISRYAEPAPTLNPKEHLYAGYPTVRSGLCQAFTPRGWPANTLISPASTPISRCPILASLSRLNPRRATLLRVSPRHWVLMRMSDRSKKWARRISLRAHSQCRSQNRWNDACASEATVRRRGPAAVQDSDHLLRPRPPSSSISPDRLYLRSASLSPIRLKRRQAHQP